MFQSTYKPHPSILAILAVSAIAFGHRHGFFWGVLLGAIGLFSLFVLPRLSVDSRGWTDISWADIPEKDQAMLRAGETPGVIRSMEAGAIRIERSRPPRPESPDHFVYIIHYQSGTHRGAV